MEQNELEENLNDGASLSVENQADAQHLPCENCPYADRSGDGEPEIERIPTEECQRECKRNFWTELLRTVTKVAGLVLAALGLSSLE